MANNRMYLRCRKCGAGFNLGKTFLDGYSRHLYEGEKDFLTEYNKFLAEHAYCSNDDNEKDIVYLEPKFKHSDYDEENGFEIAYEIWREDDA